MLKGLGIGLLGVVVGIIGSLLPGVGIPLMLVGLALIIWGAIVFWYAIGKGAVSAGSAAYKAASGDKRGSGRL